MAEVYSMFVRFSQRLAEFEPLSFGLLFARERMSCTIHFRTSRYFHLSDWIAFWVSPLRNCPSLVRLSIDFHLKTCTVITKFSWSAIRGCKFFQSEYSFFLFDNVVGRKKLTKNKTMICFTIHLPIGNYGIFIRKLFGKPRTSEQVLILTVCLEISVLNVDQGHASLGNI